MDIIDAHSRRGDRVFVWGRAPWVYSLSARLPAGRYTSLNSSYTLDPSAAAPPERAARTPARCAWSQLQPLPAAVTAFLTSLQYDEVSRCTPTATSLVAPWRQLTQSDSATGRSQRAVKDARMRECR